MNSSMEQKQPASEYQANLEVLMQIPIFAGLPVEALKVITYLCRKETFTPGEIIFQQYEQDPNAYLILEGKVGLFLDNGENTLGEFVQNDFIGGLSLFCDMKRLFSLKAQTRVTCLRLSKERFQKTLEQFPHVAGRIFERIAKSICEWEARFISEHGLKCSECRDKLGVSLI